MTAMKIEFRGGAESRLIRPRVAERLRTIVGALPVTPTSARATFTDENGPKGGNAIRCALEVRLPRRAAIHVEEVAGTPRGALDGAVAKLERQLDRVFDITREMRRRPKKYFAARRTLLS
jgi:ribosome-associated translation inhibitor RaiA